MTRNSTSSASSSCCRYLTPSGRQCRQQAEPGLDLCSRHAGPQFISRNPADFRRRLTTDCDEFTTAMGIHNSLSELYKLLAADLITARRAAVLAYIANLLLRTIPIVHSELNPDADNEPAKIHVDFGDLPRPDRSVSSRDFARIDVSLPRSTDPSSPPSTPPPLESSRP